MSDEKELRAALEQAQHENKRLSVELGELRAFDPRELLDRIHALEKENSELRQRLETADKVRTDWDARVKALRLELDRARAEHSRLLTVLEDERLAR